MSGQLKKFKDVAFRDEYPSRHVAEHEIAMSFLTDDNAQEFRAWWDDIGSAHFQAWLDKQEYRKIG